MECANSGDAAAADEHFKALLASHPEYVAGYFQYGQFLAKSGRTEEARSTLTAGIAHGPPHRRRTRPLGNGNGASRIGLSRGHAPQLVIPRAGLALSLPDGRQGICFLLGSCQQKQIPNPLAKTRVGSG